MNSKFSLRILLNSFLLSIVVTVNCFSQENASNNAVHSLSFQLINEQIKDEFNYGIAFYGGALGLSYRYEKFNTKTIFRYDANASAGLNYSKGIGLSAVFNPMEISYFIKIGHKDRDINFFIGAYSKANYRLQLYPELHSGHIFWLTNYDIGAKFYTSLKFGKHKINVNLTNSFLTMYSRPVENPETYFYDLSLSNYINQSHKNLDVFRNPKYRNSSVEVEYNIGSDSNSIFVYKLDHIILKGFNGINILCHTFSIRKKLSK